jgi:hypothetical protein
MPQVSIKFQIIFWAIVLWTFPWKGIALWKAARNNSKIWFVVLLLINTVAILDILYIFVFSKLKKIAETTKKEIPLK